MADKGLVYIGKITELHLIEGADFIISATVVCGDGGKWKGIVRRSDFKINDECLVFLPDSLLNETDHAHLSFMKDSYWRVKMRKFKGAPSEVLITHIRDVAFDSVGDDVTEQVNVVKYHKPVPAHLNGYAIGEFPSFIPKTDEPNYQRSPELVDRLVTMRYYVTEKADGSSTTAYRYKGKFGICSRNLELERNPDNGYWKVAMKYGLEEKMPEGMALQWETCGPGIQSNPMGLSEIDGFAFSGYNIAERRYLTMEELIAFCEKLDFPMCEILIVGDFFSKEGIETLGEGKYANGKQREGVVVRSQVNVDHAPISFKVINLNFER